MICEAQSKVKNRMRSTQRQLSGQVGAESQIQSDCSNYHEKVLCARVRDNKDPREKEAGNREAVGKEKSYWTIGVGDEREKK